MPTDKYPASLPPLQQQAIEWLIRLRTFELTESETREFADWLSHDLSHAHAFANAEDLFEAMTQTVQMKTAVTAPKPNSGRPDISTTVAPFRQRRPSRWLLIPLALTASWLFALNLVLPEQASLWDAYLSDYHTGTGEQRTFQLTDGSLLFLNTNTAVSVDYQDATRQIILHHGQAQFTVAGDQARPFSVSTGELQVHALGTVFEVYRKASGDIDIDVQEHAVAASLPAGGNNPKNTPVLIKQGQQLRYTHGSGILNAPETADSELTGAWRQRQVIVKNQPLAELVAEIERYRTGRIFLGSDNLSKLRVTGLFSLADPEAALTKVRKILGLKETRLGTWWVLLHH
ncbi:MAG: FecR family protein [Methylovulum sp.]|nr:FecR family protein [Methylovulum sp.]